MLSLTESRSKCMLPIANIPILEYIIQNLRVAGIRNIAIVVDHGKSGIQDHFKCGQDFGVNITYVEQMKDRRGTGAALYSAKHFIEGDGVFFVVNGDGITDYHDLIRIYCNKKPTMGLYRSRHPEEYGVVEEKDGFLVDLHEKPREPEDNLINAGVYLLDRRVFDYLEQISISDRKEFELTDAIMMYRDNGGMRCTTIEGWINVEHPWDLLDANHAMLDKNNISMYGKNTRIHHSVEIETPCSIGNNCEIGPFTHIRKYTAIGNNCKIGSFVEVKNSIIMDNTHIPHHNYVGDSVIGRNCNLGAGTKIANLRHDDDNVVVEGMSTGKRKFGAVIGDNTKVGINCSMDPGVVIHSNGRIPPHTYVSKKYLGNVRNHRPPLGSGTYPG
jgi:bifunctional UDP-N-acetylglucosamine pyrophosphorylase/glucosamine-1-phosphate N-acetyltransferase